MNSDGYIHNTNWYVCYSYLNRCGRDAARIHLRAKSVSCRHGDYFIDLLGNGFAVTLAVGGARLAPRWFRVRFPWAAGKRCGLPLSSPLGFLQLPLQPLVLLSQPFPFLAQPFPLLLQLLFPLPQLFIFLPQPLILATCSSPLLLQVREKIEMRRRFDAAAATICGVNLKRFLQGKLKERKIAK